MTPRVAEVSSGSERDAVNALQRIAQRRATSGHTTLQVDG
jgi:hypothetical protein